MTESQTTTKEELDVLMKRITQLDIEIGRLMKERSDAWGQWNRRRYGQED